jgi:hypothetical protein
METHHSNARLSIYRMTDASTFMIKRDVFVMEDAFAFVVKVDALSETRLLYLYNRKRAAETCVSLLSQKQVCLGYKLK